MTVGNLLNVHAQELESMTRNVSAVLDEVAQSHSSQSSLPDLVGEQMVEMGKLIAHVKRMKKCHHWKMQTAQNCKL